MSSELQRHACDTDPRQRPKRADAARNYDKLLAAAREVFTRRQDASLEEIARRAGVGIGTLYRNFPTRQALLEAVYLEEVEGMARAASELSDAPAVGRALRWLHRYVGFAATKRALNEALVDVDPDSDALQACRAVLLEAGTGLVERASARRRHPPGHDLCGRWPDGERDRDGADRRPGAAGADAIARTRRAALPHGRLRGASP